MFEQIESSTQHLSLEDKMTTLNQFSADTISEAIKKCIIKSGKFNIFSGGGGMNNLLLMQKIKTSLPNCRFETTDKIKVSPDAKEAVLFAVLANECICGDENHFPQNIKGILSVSMGKISLPN